MANYYKTDWVLGSGTVAPTIRHVSLGPAIGLTAVVLGLAVLIGILFPGSGGSGPVEEAVVYVQCGSSSGTGMLINSESGLILTNRHVVFNSNDAKHTQFSDQCTVTFFRGTDHALKVAASVKEYGINWDNSLEDWAVLEITNGKAPKVEVHFADSRHLQKGDAVAAWGFPMASQSCTFQSGVVNALDQTVKGGNYPWIQHSATLAPGNSGGPLTDKDGRVIGINTQIRAFQAVVNGKPVTLPLAGNANYAIPTQHLKESVLKKYAHNTF